MEKDEGLSITLEARGNAYGSFKSGSGISQYLKGSKDMGTAKLSHSHSEALDMIFSKISRIINGDANHSDSWHDIAGYALLAEKEVVNEQ